MLSLPVHTWVIGQVGSRWYMHEGGKTQVRVVIKVFGMVLMYR